MIRSKGVLWLFVGSLAVSACGDGGSSRPTDRGAAGSGATSGGGAAGSSGAPGSSGACQAQVQTGTRTECDFSQGISDPEIACDDVPVYGYVEGAQCSGTCVDVKTSASHCGECGSACDAANGWYCKDGECTDPRQGSAGSGGTGSSGGAAGGSAGSGGGPPQLPDLANLQLSVGYEVSELRECPQDIGCFHDVTVCLQAEKDNFLSVQNLGFGDSPAFELALAFEEADGERHACIMEGALGTSGPLASLGTYKTTDEFCCVANLRLPGEYRLALIADPEDTVPEYDENNNVGSTSLVTIARD